MSFDLPTTPHFLNVSGLACERDLRLLYSDIDFAVKAGELWHIKGINGAGKTTLLRQVAGLYAIDVGQVLYSINMVKMIYIGHKLGLKEQLTADENLTWLVGLDGISTQQQRHTALEKVGLKGYEETMVAQLSAGQKRRVALARLHVSKVDLWILDEPFTSIDQQGIVDEQNWLHQHTSAGGAVIMTSHQAITLPHVKTLDLSLYGPQSHPKNQANGQALR